MPSTLQWMLWTARLFGVGLLLVMGWVSPVLGVERFPPPEFEEGYQMPATTVPPPRAPGWEYVDTAVLLATLSLASYFALKTRSRRAIFGLMCFSLFYFGFYRKGCICPVGSTQDVVLALFQPGYTVPWTVVAFFFLPLVFALFFGRAFCAAVCPLGAIQDVVHVRPTKLWPWLEEALRLTPFLYLGVAILFAATGSAFVICQYDPFVAFFRRSGSFPMLLLGAVFLLVGIYLGRPYCRFLCPYGALLSLVSRFAKWNVTLSPNDCLRCQICEVACPYGAIREPNRAPSAPAPATASRAWLVPVLCLPLWIWAGIWLGGKLSTPFSRMHPTVKLAERVAAEEAGRIPSLTEVDLTLLQAGGTARERREANGLLSTRAFRQKGQSLDELYQAARDTRAQFALGTAILGGFVGLVFGLKLAGLSAVSPLTIYEPDWAHCVACGRCYTYCPKEIVRVKRFQDKKVIPLTPVKPPPPRASV